MLVRLFLDAVDEMSDLGLDEAKPLDDVVPCADYDE